MGALSKIFWLGTKEVRSLLRDTVMIALIIWAFGPGSLDACHRPCRERQQRLRRLRRRGSFRAVALSDGRVNATLFPDARRDRTQRVGSGDRSEPLYLRRRHSAELRIRYPSRAATREFSSTSMRQRSSRRRPAVPIFRKC